MKRTSRWVPILFVGDLVLAFLAQFVLSYRRDLAWAGIAGYVAALLLLGASWLGHRRVSLRFWTPRGSLVALGIGLVIWAVYFAHQRALYALAVFLWGLGLALAVAGLLAGDLRRCLPSGRQWRREAGAVFLLFALALTLRLVKLGHIPDVMTSDEGSMALEARRILEGRFSNPFGTGWFSHSNLFFYIQAASLRVFGWNLFGVRFPAAVLGALSVLAVYFLAKGVFGRETAWISGFFMAGWPLALQLGRLGLNNSADPLFGALTLGLLQRGVVRGRRDDFVGAGLALGASVYFYHGTRLLFPLVFLALAFSGGRRLRRHWRGLLAMALVAVLVIAPLAAHFIWYPDQLTGRYWVLDGLRARQFQVDQATTGESPGLLEIRHLARAMFAFIYVRDRGFFYMARLPMLGLFSGTLFVLGVGLAVARWRQARYRVLLAWIGLTVLFGGWALEFPPQYQRYLVAAPAICLLVGRAATVLLRLAGQVWRWPSSAMREMIALTAIGLLLVNAGYFFLVYVPAGDFGDLNTEIAHRTAQLMVDKGPAYTTYFFSTARMSLEGFNSVRFLAPQADWVVVSEPLQDWTFLKEERGALFVLPQGNEHKLPALQAIFPIGEARQITGHKGRILFTVYQVDAAHVSRPDEERHVEGELK